MIRGNNNNSRILKDFAWDVVYDARKACNEDKRDRELEAIEREAEGEIMHSKATFGVIEYKERKYENNILCLRRRIW